MPAQSGYISGGYSDPNAARRRMMEEMAARGPVPEPTVTSAGAGGSGGGGGGGSIPPMPAPMPPEPMAAPSPSLQGLQMATGPEPAVAGEAQLSEGSILDQGIGMRVPPSLAALLGKKAY